MAARGEYVSDFLIVSHRWEQPEEPDREGAQLRRIRAHLLTNPRIRWVWYDYSCMPQGQRTPAENVEFRRMLREVNLMYLGASVLCIVDLSYLSRFWTQFEAWLSMMKCDATRGLTAAGRFERRVAMTCVHNAPFSFKEALVEMWEDKGAADAREILARPDVTVTNQSDKDTQLEKIQELDERIKPHAPSARRGGPGAPEQRASDGPSRASVPVGQMVERLPSGDSLLFLSSLQAAVAARHRESLEEIVAAFTPDGKPPVVIALLASPGLVGLGAADRRACDRGRVGCMAGVVQGRRPFLSSEDEHAALARLSAFMEEVVLPIAISSRALVLCDAFDPDTGGECALLSSFVRARKRLEQRSGSGGGPAPFTVLAITAEPLRLYRNGDPSAYWRTVRASSRAWRARDDAMVQASSLHEHGEQKIDLLRANLLIVDGTASSPSRLAADEAGLCVRLLQCLAEHVPVVALRTGMSVSASLHSYCPLAGAIGFQLQTLLSSGVNVVSLDVRKRPKTSEGLRLAARLEAAEAHLAELRRSLLDRGLAETLDCCTLGYLHGVCFPHVVQEMVQPSRPALWAAIQQAGRRRGEGGVAGAPGAEHADADVVEAAEEAGDEQLHGLMRRVYDGIACDALELAAKVDGADAARSPSTAATGSSSASGHRADMRLAALGAQAALASPLFTGLGLHDIEAQEVGCAVLSRLLLLDLVPTHNPLEGLLLLRAAWDYHDEARYWAERYRTANLVVETVLLACLGLAVLCAAIAADRNGGAAELRFATFALSAAASLASALKYLFDLDAKRHLLRSRCESLETTAWTYRTRTGAFAEGRGAPPAESSLQRALTGVLREAEKSRVPRWRQPPARAYRHGQRCGGARAELARWADDCHSPVSAQRYLELRIVPVMDWGRSRIPVRARRRVLRRMVVVSSCLASALLSLLVGPSDSLYPVVVALPAYALAVMYWDRRTRSDKEAARQSDTLAKLQELMMWWQSLTRAEQGTQLAYTNLVSRAEEAITQKPVQSVDADPSVASRSNSRSIARVLPSEA